MSELSVLFSFYLAIRASFYYMQTNLSEETQPASLMVLVLTLAYRIRKDVNWYFLEIDSQSTRDRIKNVTTST